MNSNSSKKPTKPKVFFLFDVDNTLLNNDAVIGDIRNYLDREVGSQRNKRYWEIFERLRSSLGYADYLGALQRYRREYPHDLHLLQLSRFLINYPFANRLYPGSLDAIQHVKKWGPVALLSDGDVVFQPRKVERSSLLEVVEGRAMIYVHKEKELKYVERRHPAHHYVLVDDKLRILTAVKEIWRTRVTTVFVRQGHYALDPKILAKYPPADVDIQSIADIVKLELGELVCGRVPPPKTKSK